jgi:opacity protein-like surface antigen
MKSPGIVLFFLVLVATMLATPANSAFDRERSVEFTFAAGISSPTDDYAKVAANGSAYNFSLGFTPKALLTLSVEYGRKNNPFSEPGKYLALHQLGYTVSSAEYKSSHIGVSAKFLFTDRPTTPYVRAAVAQWSVKSHIETVQSTYNSTNEYTGFLMGFGYQMEVMSHIGVFGELAYSGFHRKGGAQNSDIQILVGLQLIIPAH